MIINLGINEIKFIKGIRSKNPNIEMGFTITQDIDKKLILKFLKEIKKE